MQKTKYIEDSWDIAHIIESFCAKPGVVVTAVIPVEYRKGLADTMQLTKALILYKEVHNHV